MTYRDMTFCSASCSTTVCFRHLSNVPEGCTEPIAQADFSHDCPMYRQPRPVRIDTAREIDPDFSVVIDAQEGGK